MNHLVKITFDHYGEKIATPVWHLVNPIPSEVQGRTLCGGEVFGDAESRVVYKTKSVQRGGITCPMCIRDVKLIKSVNL
jgi:hypothetical protein